MKLAQKEPSFNGEIAQLEVDEMWHFTQSKKKKFGASKPLFPAVGEPFPVERHIVGKTGAHMIERDNTNSRHHLGRLTCRTKVISKSATVMNSAFL